MRRFSAAFMLVFFVICSVAVSLGYAAVTDTLTITGSVEVPQKEYIGIFISDVKVVSTSGVTSRVCEYSKPTNLSNQLTVSSSNATITYEITVTNNSDTTYWYLGAAHQDSYGSNSLIDKTGGIFITTKDVNTASGNAFDTEDWVPPHTDRVFYATYRFGSSATGTVSTLVNFKFGLQMDAVQDEFLKILNDKISNNGYEFLSDAFDDKYAEDGTTVIGNIGEDEEIFDKMFGENIMININGTLSPVTVMVSRKNVDGNANTGDAYAGNGAPSGCEYTVYITTESLDGRTATVYAVSYTCRNGVWYQLGELYEGTCNVATYDKEGNKCFDITSWDATAKVYWVTDDISYKVGYEQGTTYDKYDTIEELLSANDQEFYNAVNNNSGKLLKPVCNAIYSYVHQNGQWIESTNTANSYRPGYDQLRNAFEKIKPYCYIGNGAQEVKIQNANSLTRAELIQLLEEIQHAYDYYNSVNGL